MNIGFDAKRAFLNKSGLGNYSRDIIRSLSNLYPDNKYVLFSPKAKTELLESGYIQNLINPKSINKFIPSVWRSLFMGHDIKKSNVDIYHGLSNELPANINRSKAIKIVTIHDLIFKKMPELYAFADCKIYDLKFKNACNNADKIIAISNQTKSDIIEYYNIPEEKIVVIYQGCNPLFYEKSTKDELINVKKKFSIPEDFLLTVGTIEKRKNVLNVVKALYYFNIKIPYVLIGKKTKYFDEVLSYAKDYNLSNQIIHLENVNNAELRSIYQLCNIFLYPSIYEGFGIPVLEAQNSGVPVITSEMGSTSEAAGKGAILINPHNPKSIGIAIKAIFESHKVRSELIHKGFENATIFNQKNVSEKLMNLYTKLYERNCK